MVVPVVFTKTQPKYAPVPTAELSTRNMSVSMYDDDGEFGLVIDDQGVPIEEEGKVVVAAIEGRQKNPRCAFAVLLVALLIIGVSIALMGSPVDPKIDVGGLNPTDDVAVVPFLDATVIIIGDHPLSTTREEYISYTVDTSYDRDFFNRKLNDPHLMYLTKSLGPSIVRVGGTGGDWLRYKVPGGIEEHCVPDIRPPQLSERSVFVMECLNMTWYHDLHELISQSNSKMIFGLNICYPSITNCERVGGTKEDPIGFATWNYTNSVELLKYSIANNLKLFGLELGNEKNEVMSGSDQARHTMVLSTFLTSLYPDVSTRPLLAGPDPHSFVFNKPAEISQDHGFFKQYLQTLQSAKVPLAGITYHEYVGVMDDASSLNGINLPDLAVNPKQYGALDIAVRNHQILAERRDKFAPGVEIWGGEVANKNRGGGGWGQTFGTALWYFDAIGLKATLGQTMFFRQDLFGASYGLLNSTTLEPTPSYFVALLGKKLLGRKVLKTTLGEGHTLNKSLRTYAFCNRFTTGGISLLLVNVSKRDIVVNVRVAVENDEKGTLQNRHEDYYFTPATGRLSSDVTLMNGKPLALDSSKKVPEWISEAKGSPSKSELITVKGSTFAIVTLYDANAKACLEP